MRVGILPLGRPTFDVPFAEEKLAAMLAALDARDLELIGPRTLLMDGDATAAAVDGILAANVECLLVLQVTFTDASAIVAASNRIAAPMAIWATPEPRLGGRLRLNAFCGLNLASHALGLSGREFGWLYADPSGEIETDLSDLLAGRRRIKPVASGAVPGSSDFGKTILASIKGKRIGRLGAHPDGFDTCAYDVDAMSDLAGVQVDALELDVLFERARALPDDAAVPVLAQAQNAVSGLDQVDQAELDRSLRLKVALDDLRAEGGYDAFAIRCWPETFTEYGGAVCGPVSMLGEARVPCACEADVYGALTQLVLQEVARDAVFLTDLVDLDETDNTGVVWHCGQAPISMCAGDASATIHTNRKMPLLYEFTLKPGRVTLMRISQAQGVPKMILSGADMLDRAMTFTGTSGVLQFDRNAGDVMQSVMDTGLEHHMALVYGDHRAALRDVAGAMGLPVLEI